MNDEPNIDHWPLTTDHWPPPLIHHPQGRAAFDLELVEVHLQIEKQDADQDGHQRNHQQRRVQVACGLRCAPAGRGVPGVSVDFRGDTVPYHHVGVLELRVDLAHRPVGRRADHLDAADVGALAAAGAVDLQPVPLEKSLVGADRNLDQAGPRGGGDQALDLRRDVGIVLVLVEAELPQQRVGLGQHPWSTRRSVSSAGPFH